MANDDRILLNLILNEATVSAVEGRVRNLVNRLNNTNISLNIDTRNLNNIENLFNRIQQQMQTINTTPVNINANLTSEQQQYRLETERMRASQQLELSRQRTLQTENQAISALAQQNRTLTVNNNITHQIEQGAQNIGNNMNVAGGHARDFVDYLSDGVRYLVTYRSLYAVMNQIGEAFSEMKNVDTAAIQVRKTTGMSKDEIEAIKKASYGVATEYGRSASEYLESVSEFARAGYKQHSTELGKLSLLTQNVGDVSAESADKMLLAVDAAYQLEGNVTELTNVINALNNIANKNPTSMQKMADGLQVSASMAKTAGMDISDLTALIGTGTAVTQREGAEVARAIRTIVMNIRSVKGELEDGTIIDDDSIAKAEAALKGVGISTKEVVNGVRELRNPMDILDELAEKWHTLGTEAQSVLTESIANKRQANVLSGILDNWSMVEKMQSEYFNSANSAIEENILYLEGWEAKSKVVSAKWTEYISNLADTKVITGTLDALYGLLTALDTPIGRIATQIVLVNTALAVTGRLWQQIRARSIVAEILSIGVADRQLGTAIGIVTEHLGRQALAWATSPFGMATIAVAGITLITSAIEKNKQKLKETAQEASNQAEESAKAVSGLLDLKTQLAEGTKSSDELTSAFKEQLKAMGYTETQIDNLITKYGGLSGAMDEATRNALEKAKIDAHTDVSSSSDLLKNTAGKSGYNIAITPYKTGDENLDNEISEILSKVAKYDGGEAMAYLPSDMSADGLYAYYQALQEISQLIQETASNTNNQNLLDMGGMFDASMYGQISKAINTLSQSADLYSDAIGRLHSADAQLELADYLKTNSINSKEAFNSYIEGIQNSTEYSDAYKQVLIDVANDAFPQFSNAAKDAGENADGMMNSLSDLEKTSDKIKILGSAFKELSEDGYITIKTLGEIQTATGLSGNEWEEYQNKLMKAKVGSAEFKQVLSDLTYRILENEFGIEGLTEANEANIEAVLRENGVTNASAVTQSIIARAKAINANETENVTAKTRDEINAIISEGFHAGWTTEQFHNLIREHILLNNTNLTLDDKIAMIEKIGLAAGWSAAYVSHLVELLNSASNVGRTSTVPSDGDRSGSAELGLWKSGLWTPVEIPEFTPPEITTPNYSGAASDKGSSSKSTFDDSYYSTIDAWMTENEKRIESLEKEQETLNRQFENALDSGNKDRAEILRDKLAENAQMQKDILHEQNEAHRITQGELLQSLYQYAPSLSGKTWDEISEVDLVNIENELNKDSELASTDDAKNQAKYNLNHFKGIVEDLKNIDDAIKDNSDAWWENEENIKGYYESLIDFQDEYSRNWIDEQKSFDRMTDEEELAAYGRMIENNKKFKEQILADTRLTEESKEVLIKQANDNIIEIEKDAYDKRKELFDEYSEFGSSYYDSQKTVLTSYYNVLNDVAETQHEINKELEASKTMYEWLDKDLQDKLFNQKDYNILSEELYDIQYKAEKLQRQYQRDLEGATLNTIEEITSNYEMQYETLMKSYEIAKAELDVAKKRKQLDNVLAEKNVKMLINGQWKWVAKTQDVINAQSELADAEWARKTAEAGAKQTESINDLTEKQNKLGTTIKLFEDGVIDLDTAVGKVKQMFDDLPTAMQDAIDLMMRSSTSNNGTSSDSSSNKTSGGGSGGSSSKTQSRNNATATIPGFGEVGVEINDAGKTVTTGLPVGTIVHTGGGDYKITGGTGGSYESVKLNEYANGTKNADKGWATINEILPEGIMTKDGTLIPMANFEGGEMVFNHKMMENLWRQAQIPWNIHTPSIPNFVTKQPSVVDQSVTFTGDITVNNPVDLDGFVNDLTTRAKSYNAITKKM